MLYINVEIDKLDELVNTLRDSNFALHKPAEQLEIIRRAEATLVEVQNALAQIGWAVYKSRKHQPKIIGAPFTLFDPDE